MGSWQSKCSLFPCYSKLSEVLLRRAQMISTMLETSGLLLLPPLFGYLVVSEQNSFAVFSSFDRNITAQMEYLREVALYTKKIDTLC